MLQVNLSPVERGLSSPILVSNLYLSVSSSVSVSFVQTVNAAAKESGDTEGRGENPVRVIMSRVNEE